MRSLYRFVVIDMGRLSPFSARIAEETGRLYLVSTCDLLALNAAKGTVGALCQAGFDPDRFELLLNQSPKPPAFSSRELEKILGVRVEVMLPEARQDFTTALLNGKPLGESRIFQKHLAQFAARLAGVDKDPPLPKSPFSFLPAAFRNAPTGT